MQNTSPILEQVPVDYYGRGIRSNLFQWLWHSWKWHSLQTFLKGINGKILDIGCADGSLTQKIAAFLPQSELTGLDYYKKTIDHAQKTKPNINFVHGDARKLPFKANYFDAVVCVETLEHIAQPEKVLAEIHRVLRPQGVLIISQDSNNPIFKIIWFFWTKYKGKVWNNAHVACMSPAELTVLVGRSQFRIIYRKTSHLGLEMTLKAKKI